MNKPALTAPPAPQKFKTLAQIMDRINWLQSQQFAKGERGIGARDRELKAMTKRLQELQQPCFGEIDQPPLL